ncbi:hypothetical protein QE152_g15512 [Popillia japonica]|uniref:Uncharacterized protein n=1 Tax=Popillia japonica TaxID=7064 RepID=A0AAW1L5B6_POPJA
MLNQNSRLSLSENWVRFIELIGVFVGDTFGPRFLRKQGRILNTVIRPFDEERWLRFVFRSSPRQPGQVRLHLPPVLVVSREWFLGHKYWFSLNKNRNKFG